MGRYDLHLTEDEFWSLTLKELNALFERHGSEQEWLNYRAAMVCSVMANIFRGKLTRLYKPADFMPNARPKEQTPEQMLAAVELLNAAFGGEVAEV